MYSSVRFVVEVSVIRDAVGEPGWIVELRDGPDWLSGKLSWTSAGFMCWVYRSSLRVRISDYGGMKPTKTSHL